MRPLEGLKFNDPFVKSLPIEWHGVLHFIISISLFGLLRCWCKAPLAVLFVV